MLLPQDPIDAEMIVISCEPWYVPCLALAGKLGSAFGALGVLRLVCDSADTALQQFAWVRRHRRHVLLAVLWVIGFVCLMLPQWSSMQVFIDALLYGGTYLVTEFAVTTWNFYLGIVTYVCFVAPTLLFLVVNFCCCCRCRRRVQDESGKPDRTAVEMKNPLRPVMSGTDIRLVDRLVVPNRSSTNSSETTYSPPGPMHSVHSVSLSL